VVLSIIVNPLLLIGFLISAIFLAALIFIIIYLNKAEVLEAFQQDSQQSDSYKIPSDFGDPVQDDANDYEEFDTARKNKVVLEPTVAAKDSSFMSEQLKTAKTRLTTYQPSIIAMVVEDLGGGRYRSYNISKEKTTIGRSNKNDIHLKDDETVGREHAQILFRQGKFWLYDLASTNSSYVNGKKIEKHDLVEGDEILLGTKLLIFKTL
jgi:hypothetical protein